MAVNQMFFKGDEQPVFDLTQDTVTSDNLLEGVTAHDSSGEAIKGTLTAVKDVVDSDENSLVTDGIARIPKYLENTASGSSSLTIDGNSTVYSDAINIGKQSAVNTDGVAIGYYALANRSGGVSIGKLSQVEGNYGIAIGYNAMVAAENSIQIGFGSCSEDNTANFGSDIRPIDKITRYDRNVQRTVECVCMDETAPKNFNYSGAKGMMSISDDGNYLYVHNGTEWRQIPLNTFIYQG